MAELASADEALAFVAEHGIVLATARGPLPRLIDRIAGSAIVGNWWTHPQARAIYPVLESVQTSGQVLVCRLVNDKLTLVHERLWPALAKLAPQFAPRQLARVVEQHTSAGRHAVSALPLADWLPSAVWDQAQRLDEAQAIALVGRWRTVTAAAP